jgi:hypothetical protein
MGFRALTSVLVVMIVAIVAPAEARAAAPADGRVSITLSWTAPGDDSLSGRAALYDLRYSLTPIAEAGFAAARRLALLRPGPPGCAESFTVTGLLPDVDYYFAIRTSDEAGNWSRPSNVAYRPARAIQPEPALGFELSSPWPNPARTDTRFRLALPGREAALIEAFDGSGRRVRTIVDGVAPAGRSELVWDLRDDRGVPLRAGVYLVRARIGERLEVRRVAIVR